MAGFFETAGRVAGSLWRSITGGAKATAVGVGLAVTAPSKGMLGDEVGISGTANFGGEVVAESNHKLLWNLAHGTPGVRGWGEWEKARRTDEAVAKSLNHVLGPVRDSRVDVVEAADNPNGKAHAEFIRECIKNVSPGWSEFLTQSLGGALMSGFALHEECWSVVESKWAPSGKGMAITKMAERLPNSVKSNGWLESDDGDLRAIAQLGPRGSKWENVELPASKVFLNTWDRSGNNYLGYSVYRPVWYLIQIRAEIAKIIGVSMVREGAGIPIAISKDDNSQELTEPERETLQEFISNCVYHENAGVIMPRGWDLKWLFSPSTSRSAIIEAYNHLGLMVMAQVGAQQLNLGTGSTGSRSVGEVHDATSIAFIQGALSHQEDLLNGVSGRAYTGWVRKQIDFTFGPQKSYPRVKLTLKKPQLPVLERFTAAKLAKDAGLISKWTRDDENVAREEVGFAPVEEMDEGTEADDQIDPNAPVDPTAVAAVAAGEPGAEGADGAPKAQDTALNGAQVVAAQAIVADVGAKKLEPASGLAMLKYFFNLDESKAKEILGTMGTGFEPPTPPPPPAPFGGGPKDTAPVAPDAPAPVAAQGSPAAAPLKAADASGFVPRRPLRPSEQHLNLTAMAATFDAAPEQFANTVRPIAAKMLMQALPAVTAALEAGNPTAVGEIKLDVAELDAAVGAYLEKLRLAGYHEVRAEKGRKSLTAASEEDDQYSTPASDDAQSTLDAARKHLVRKISNRLTSDLEKEAIDADRTDGDASDVVARTLEFQTSSGAFKSDASLVTTKAFNVGRQEFADEYGKDIESAELSAAMDNATCGPCERLDGTEFDFGSPEEIEHTPPLSSICDGGDRCRCIKIFSFKKPVDGEGDA